MYNIHNMRELIVGSRGSQLALCQTHWIINRLKELRPDVTCRVQIIKTTGDKIQDVPLSRIGDKGLFVKDIELALLSGEIDFAVHSAKDLPSEMTPELCVGAYPEREDPSDALISKCGGFSILPSGATIGTSSLRRRAQLLYARQDLCITDLRGNLDTRLRKLDNGDYDAIILAAAGLKRLDLADRITEFLPLDICLPAAGQGALAVQCRKGDPAGEIVSALDDASTRRCITAERALLAGLGGGCQVPIAALAREIGSRLEITACVASIDGTDIIKLSESGELADAQYIGSALATRILDTPAKKLLSEIRSSDEVKGMGAA